MDEDEPPGGEGRSDVGVPYQDQHLICFHVHQPVKGLSFFKDECIAFNPC